MSSLLTHISSSSDLMQGDRQKINSQVAISSVAKFQHYKENDCFYSIFKAQTRIKKKY